MMKGFKRIGGVAICLLGIGLQSICCMAQGEFDEELRYEDISEPQKIVLVYDNSGSAREMAALDHDIKYIFYEVLWEDPLTDCSIFQFNQDISYYAQGDVWKPELSRQETDIVSALEAVNWYLAHGKERAFVVLVSDLYDTYGEGKLDTFKDKELIAKRKERARTILTGWEANDEYSLSTYTWKSQSEEKAGYTQVNFKAGDQARLDLQSSEKTVRDCFAKAQQLRTGEEAIQWKEFAEISPEDEEAYLNYYIWSEDKLSIDERKSDYIIPILEEIETEGNFYLVEGLPLTELGFRKSWKEIYLMPAPQLQIEVACEQYLDEDEKLHTDRLAAIYLSMFWCGKQIEREDLTFRLKEVPINEEYEHTEDLCMLEYDQEKKKYVGYFDEKTAGDYQLRLYFDKENGDTRIVERKEISVFLPNVRLWENEKFTKDLRKIETAGLKSVELDLKDYVSPRITEEYTCISKVEPKTNEDKIILKSEVKSENGAQILVLERTDKDADFSGIAKYWVDIEIRYKDEENRWNGNSYHEGFELNLYGKGRYK